MRPITLLALLALCAADETRLEHPTLRKRSHETKEVGLSDAARAALLARPSPARLDAPASVPIPS